MEFYPNLQGTKILIWPFINNLESEILGASKGQVIQIKN